MPMIVCQGHYEEFEQDPKEWVLATHHVVSNSRTDGRLDYDLHLCAEHAMTHVASMQPREACTVRKMSTPGNEE